MGPSTRPRNDTRVRKTHPPKKPPRKPAAQSPERAKRKERALREGIKGFLAADQIARDAVHHLPEPTLKPPRTRRDGVPADELHEIRRRLKLVQSCALVVGAALKDQNVGLDSEAADILGTHVTDALHIQLMKLDRLLGREVDDDDIEEGEGGAS